MTDLEKLRCVTHELERRKRLMPVLVEGGMKQADANYILATWEAIVADYRKRVDDAHS